MGRGRIRELSVGGGREGAETRELLVREVKYLRE